MSIKWDSTPWNAAPDELYGDAEDDGILADYDPGDLQMCEACTRGDHANCGMQHWCQCPDESDGQQDF